MKIKAIKRGLATAFALVITLFISGAPSYAGTVINLGQANATVENGGIVLPAKAEPKGYSLSDMAKATAYFNVTDHSGVFPSIVNGKPFQGLFTTSSNTFNVSEGTMLYVPVQVADDSPPIIGDFPNVANRLAVENYFYSHKELGFLYTTITVDGKVTSLNHEYLVGVKVPPLPDGGGTQYMVVAAFLTPLNKGTHTVEISILADGDALCAAVGSCPYSLSATYTVIVK